jgi:hypothetical protein
MSRLFDFKLYRDYKITGSVNLSYGFNIPLLIHESLKSNPDYQLSAFFYSDNELIRVLNSLSKKPESLKSKSLDISRTDKFSYNFQKKIYMDFIMK